MDSAKRIYNGFQTENAFEVKRFLSPDDAYSPIYTWMWNARLSREETDRQIEEMRRLGIKRFYILPMPKSFRPTSFPTPLEPEYLSDGYFEEYRYALDRAKEAGMSAWLYDEGGWPSGGACGQVMLADPTLVQEHIELREKTVRKGETYHRQPDVEAAFFGNIRISQGSIIPNDGTVDEYVRVNTSFPIVSSADLPDITKAGASETFIKLTHERYAKSVGDLTKAGVTALFTDEPTAPRPFPYTDEIKALFRKRFGEEIEDHLPVLLGRVKPSKRSAEIKIAFYDMLSRLFIERFLDKEKGWAHRMGLAYVGHLDKDDEANGSVTGGNFGLLRALRVFDVPGVDAIRRQIFPPKGKRGLYGENKFFVRYASSAAAQTGGRHALSESFAVYGAGVSYDEMRYVMNFQAMRGVNVMNLMVVPYGRKGYLQAGLLPHFTEETYPDLSDFNLYLTRLSYLFSLGERRADVALYYPIQDGIAGNTDALKEYEKAGSELEARRILFDVIDDDLLTGADPRALERGMIGAGRARYTTVVLPSAQYLSEDAIQRLSAFRKNGGTVLSYSKELAETLGASLVRDLSALPSPCPLHGADGISYAESVTMDGKLSFLMNENDDARTLRIPTSGRAPYLIDPASGKVVRTEEKGGAIEITLESGEIICLYDTNRMIEAEAPFREMGTLELTDFTYRPTSRLTIGETTERSKIDAEELPLTADGGFEKDFSGSVLYRTTFVLPQGVTRAVLDLGKAEGAAEATLNGVSLGAVLAPPYRFDLPIDLLKTQNELSVIVTNTAANEYLRTDAFDRYRPWQLGGYFREESAFHRDSERGGLFGSVKIHYNKE
ncbi:MAG: hypothetical protein J5765_04195 [Clostridia bacterium]|nr:hypothetical protein [Clostridia bacterium]